MFAHFVSDPLLNPPLPGYSGFSLDKTELYTDSMQQNTITTKIFIN
jgi:hypothetical protein